MQKILLVIGCLMFAGCLIIATSLFALDFTAAPAIAGNSGLEFLSVA